MTTDPVSAIRATYDILAPRWDAWTATVTPELRVERANWVADQVQPSGRVLELGCGSGIPVAEALIPVCTYVGIDLSPKMVELARSNLPSGTFHVDDMRHIDFPQASFDGVVAFYSIIHVPIADQPALIGRVFSWLRPGGVFVATFGSTDDRDDQDPNWLDAGPMHWSSLGATAYRELTESRGFEIIDDAVIPQLEGSDPVEFLWLTCRRPEQSHE